MCGDVLCKQAELCRSADGETNLIFTGSGDLHDSCPSPFNIQNLERRTMESVISPVCALRVIKIRGHSLLAQLRQRGASEQCSCFGLFGCPSPCISLATSNTRLHSTRPGTNVSLCGSEWPSFSERIESKCLRDRQKESEREIGYNIAHHTVVIHQLSPIFQYDGGQLNVGGQVTTWKPRNR